jgi:ABC-type transporter MlaC component
MPKPACPLILVLALASSTAAAAPAAQAADAAARPSRAKTVARAVSAMAKPHAEAAATTAADAAAGQKVVRALVNAIRYGKDQMAIDRLGLEHMSQMLLEDAWAGATPVQQHDFVEGLRTLLVRTSFPRGREMFAYLDALLFKGVTTQGEDLHLRSVVVVHRNLKKVELPLEWVLVRAGPAWQVVDIVSMGDSTAEGIRDEEVRPLRAQGGIEHVLAAMQERIHKLPAEADDKAAP